MTLKIPPGRLPQGIAFPQGLIVPGGGVTPPPPTSAATWSVVDKNGNVTISGAGLIATGGGAGGVNYAGRGTTLTTAVAAAVKRFWKVVPTNASGSVGVGVCDVAAVFSDGAYLGNLAGSFGWYPNGQVFSGGGLAGTIAAYVSGDTLGLAVIGGNQLWGSVNGVFTGDPVGGTGGIDISGAGTIYPAYNLQAGDVVPAAFVASGGPAGFSNFP